MRVAINTTPTKTGHRVRGIGAYTQNLINQLKKESRGVQFEFFSKPSAPPPADVIHYPYFDLFFHTLPVNKKTRRVVTIHDVIPLVFPTHFPVGVRGSINLFLQKKALKNTDFVICDSRASKNDIVDKLSYPQDRIKVIYLAPGEKFKKITDSQKLSNISQKYKLPKDFAIYVGDVNWHKNVLGLLQAIKITHINLVMVGHALTNNSLEQTKEINTRIKKLGLESQIIKTGFIPEEDLITLYNLATVTVLPSFYEGFGLPVLESMACGTPVVCSKVGSLAEIAGPATICDPQNPSDIAKKLLTFVNLSSKQRNDLSPKLISYASSFTWQKVARQTLGVYESLCKK